MSETISVVIPAHNASETLARCLDGLFSQSISQQSFEIIVVDDGSGDTTRAIAATRDVQVLQQANLGAASARNLGAQNARGEIVLFIDADCVPDARWIEEMIAPLANESIVGAGGMKQTCQRGFMPAFIQMEFDHRYDHVKNQPYIDFIDSGTAAYRRKVFLKNGGFDTRLADAEDAELSFRLSAQDYRMAFARGAVVYHFHPDSLLTYLKRKFVYSYWRSFVYGKFPQKIARDSRTPQTQKIQSALALLCAAAVAMIPFWSIGIWTAVLIGAILLVTTLPFAVKYFARDRRVALLAPFLIALSAFATGAGVALGFLRQWMDLIAIRFTKDSSR